MVSWYFLIIAAEVGVFIGFIIAAMVAFSQMKKINKNILNHQFHQHHKNSLFLCPELKREVNQDPAE